MRKAYLLLFAIVITINTFAQSKVAVFDPEDKNNTGFKDVMREMLSTGISKSTFYKPVERALIEKVLEENKYQSTGMVDESKISELGKQMGADFVCVSMIQKIGTNFFITVKLVNVTTASVEFQEYIKTTDGEKDLFEKIEALANKLSSAKSTTVSTIKTELKPEVPTININYQTYMVLPKDLYDTYNWQQAKDACDNLKAYDYDDWYLPNKTELAGLYENKDIIGSFVSSNYYWSSTDTSKNAWGQSFRDGHQGNTLKHDRNHVRCVRRK